MRVEELTGKADWTTRLPIEQRVMMKNGTGLRIRTVLVVGPNFDPPASHPSALT